MSQRTGEGDIQGEAADQGPERGILKGAAPKTIRVVTQGAEPQVSPTGCLLWSPVGDIIRAEVFIDEIA